MTKSSIINKRLVGLFLLGCVLTNYPIISLFNLKRLFFGLPLLYLYMFSVWAALIILIFLVTKSRSIKPVPDTPQESEPIDPC